MTGLWELSLPLFNSDVSLRLFPNNCKEGKKKSIRATRLHLQTKLMCILSGALVSPWTGLLGGDCMVESAVLDDLIDQKDRN